MSGSQLISVTELNALLSDPKLVLLDVRYSLTDAAYGRAAYAEGHIPVSYTHLDVYKRQLIERVLVMRKLFTALFLTGVATGLWAQVNDAPPAYIPPSNEVQRNAPPAPNLNADVKRSNRDARETYEASRLEPSERDMQRAREERSKRVDTGKVTKYRSEYGTIIEETHDQNNRVTDVRVTPGSTEIPYTICLLYTSLP